MMKTETLKQKINDSIDNNRDHIALFDNGDGTGAISVHVSKIKAFDLLIMMLQESPDLLPVMRLSVETFEKDILTESEIPQNPK